MRCEAAGSQALLSLAADGERDGRRGRAKRAKEGEGGQMWGECGRGGRRQKGRRRVRHSTRSYGGSSYALLQVLASL